MLRWMLSDNTTRDWSFRRSSTRKRIRWLFVKRRRNELTKTREKQTDLAWECESARRDCTRHSAVLPLVKSAFGLAWISSDYFESFLLLQLLRGQKRLEAIGWNSGYTMYHVVKLSLLNLDDNRTKIDGKFLPHLPPNQWSRENGGLVCVIATKLN